MKNYTKGFIAPLLLALIALLLIGGGAYVYTQKKQENPPMTGNVTLPQATSTTRTTKQANSTTQTSSSQTTDWKTYTNNQYGFSIKYPATWVAHGYWSENGGFFYIGFGDENAIRTKPSAMLRIYTNQSSINTFKDKVYFQGNWKNITLGGLPAFEIVDVAQTTKNQFLVIVSIKDSHRYELESTVFDDTVDIVRTMSSTFKFTP